MPYFKYYLAFTIAYMLSNVYEVVYGLPVATTRMSYPRGSVIKTLLTRDENDVDIDNDNVNTDADANLNNAAPVAILTAESIQSIQTASESHVQLEMSLSTQSETSSYDATSLQMNLLSGSLQDMGIDIGALSDIAGM